MINWNRLNEAERRAALARPAVQQQGSIVSRCNDIIETIAADGDGAVLAYTEAFDGIKLDSVRLDPACLLGVSARLPGPLKAAIDTAYANIRAFHLAQRQRDISLDTQVGVRCELRYAPIERVGLYVPGGSAPLPSSVLMLGIPAQVAGCGQIALCTPPNKDGGVNDAILYAATLCGIDEIYPVGGAQAIAAMGIGTPSIARVDKLFGPGNSYVTAAKQLVSGLSGGPAMDMPAGPSEVLILADESANPAFVAADMLSQAEHGADSQTLVLCNDSDTLVAIEGEIRRQLAGLGRRDIATAALKHSRLILTDSPEQSIAISNRYAPEHLIIQLQDAEARLGQVTNAGSIFVGPWSPESAGDYASGTNHVLPTYGYARGYSSLGTLDFMRRYTIQTLTPAGLKGLAPTLLALADAEGLGAHANAVSIRMEALRDED